jgi:hypothetical protein
MHVSHNLLFRGFDTGQHAYLLQYAIAQILSFVDDQQHLPSAVVLVYQELIQSRQNLRLLHVEGREAELNQHGLQEGGGRQLRLIDLRNYHFGPHLAQESLDERGLAGADFAGDHYETIRKPDRRFHVRFGACMLFAQVEKLRIRTQTERQFIQFEQF